MLPQATRVSSGPGSTTRPKGYPAPQVVCNSLDHSPTISPPCDRRLSSVVPAETCEDLLWLSLTRQLPGTTRMRCLYRRLRRRRIEEPLQLAARTASCQALNASFPKSISTTPRILSIERQLRTSSPSWRPGNSPKISQYLHESKPLFDDLTPPHCTSYIKSACTSVNTVGRPQSILYQNPSFSKTLGSALEDKHLSGRRRLTLSYLAWSWPRAARKWGDLHCSVDIGQAGKLASDCDKSIALHHNAECTV